jgi:hypothetical protein
VARHGTVKQPRNPGQLAVPAHHERGGLTLHTPHRATISGSPRRHNGGVDADVIVLAVEAAINL